MKFITEALKLTPEYKQLKTAVTTGKVPAVLTGVTGIHKCAVLYSLLRETGKKALVLCADEPECIRFGEDLTAMGMNTAFYPARDFSLRDTQGASHEYERQRLDVLNKINAGETDIVLTTVDAALQFTIPQEELRKRCIKIYSGQQITIDEILNYLVVCGYTRDDQIDGTGQFSHRGGIIDFFPPGSDYPVRVEFWGDEIDTISYFDPETQRRTDNIDFVLISPCVEVLPESKTLLIKKIEAVANSLRGKNAPKARTIMQGEIDKIASGLHLASMDKYISLVYEKPATLLNYFDEEFSLLVLSEGSALKERMRTTLWQWGEDIKDLMGEGILCKSLDTYTEDWPYLLMMAERLPSIHMDTFARGTYEIPTKTLINMTVKQLSVWGGSTELLVEDLNTSLYRKYRMVVLAGTEKTAKTLAEDLKAAGLPAGYLESISTVNKGTIAVTHGTLSAGFEIPNAEFAVLTHGRVNDTSRKSSKKKKKDKNQKEIYSLAELSVGDYVVHTTHGIGIFEGIHKMELQGIIKDYIRIRYAQNDTLYVPVTQLDLVSKYIGPREDSGIKLHRLGGQEWQKQKTRVRAAVKDIAKELIKLYAERMKVKGFAFPEDTEWQRDFEAHFGYDETEDQLRCIEEIKNDMESVHPMDRLLCGDVGFGKTEVALRAAFKAITAGKQVALLVPTTILAWQHYQTVLRRMEGFPVSIELLSRFRNGKQQAEILKKLKRGSVDMIVGTHRLVSKDVEFKDLGLVIIDEEQRFGVAQKEKLKEVSKSADVLTLSATPIPRTLNMALSGIRDMSVIEEAPHDRHPVQTYVMEHDDGVITDAIKRELRRGGQCYYLHNDVASIERVAAGIQARVPDARIGIGHGKMSEQELSEVWRQLIDREIDILVCTTIIETGVDVPNANTLIIDNADRMGLSQLHQLRGRVGRSNRRAYAYFTFAKNKTLSEISQKRLTAIREFTEFGSGFKIAMRDLEIRGAGNILGGEQHGHMETVGYDMYIKLLNEAVALMKGEEPPPVDKECVVDMQVQAHIPEDYIESTNLRLDVYRRIADIKSFDDSLDVIDELVDRFGEPPMAVKGLIDIALNRNIATSLGITEIKQMNGSLLLYADKFDMKRVSQLIAGMKGRVLLNASTTPYISINLRGQPPLDVLEDAMKLMTAEDE
ncbi:MAG: transcription-repair coupling factor [Clostridia bacterium]|nr:transcription-repair coupling factor [Clostridia bacterium]